MLTSDGFDLPEAPEASEEALLDLLEPVWELPSSEPLPRPSDEPAPTADAPALDAPAESPPDTFSSDEAAFSSDEAAALSDEAAFLYSSLR